MRRSTALFCFGLWLCNVALCQLEAGDRLARLLDELHEPCDFERGCNLRSCSLPHCAVLQPQPSPRPFQDDVEPRGFDAKALWSVPGGPGPELRARACDRRSLCSQAGSHPPRLNSWLQVFLC